MRAHEYVEKATVYIGDPAKMAEVRRELQAHLDAAMEEAQAQGLDPDSAEVLAVGKMGSPDTVAVPFGVAHHSHLPWRVYLTPVPLYGLYCLSDILPAEFGPWPSLFMLGLALWCLLPDLATLKRWGRFVYIDVVAKREWLRRQPLRASLVAGGSAGLLTGGTFTLLPLLFKSMSRWPLLADLIQVWPVLLVVAYVSVVLFVRRFHKGDWLMTGAFAALTFPVGSLPFLLLNWRAGLPAFWGAVNVTSALFAMASGWAVRSYQQRRSLASR